jgi:hypothetical protein
VSGVQVVMSDQAVVSTLYSVQSVHRTVTRKRREGSVLGVQVVMSDHAG